VRKADSLTPSCSFVMKSGDVNFVEPSGSLRACNGTALPLPLPLENVQYHVTIAPCTLATPITQFMFVEMIARNFL
jgi:hypothetical protein